jgi:hypothetical protein
MKNKTLLLFWLIAVSLTICSCKSDNRHVSDNVVADPYNYKVRMDKEMEAETQKFLESITTKCEDSYYGYKNQHQLFEFKKMDVFSHKGEAPKPKQLTEAERLNQKQEGKVDNTVNPEWQGEAMITGGANRYYSYGSKQWSRWQDEESIALRAYGNIKLVKLNGQWVSEPSFQDLQNRYSKPDCSEIPK